MMVSHFRVQARSQQEKAPRMRGFLCVLTLGVIASPPLKHMKIHNPAYEHMNFSRCLAELSSVHAS
jgi:hypothetical protein